MSKSGRRNAYRAALLKLLGRAQQPTTSADHEYALNFSGPVVAGAAIPNKDRSQL